ncbi:MAG: hypothetical protein Aurels2KO_53320 [Aureliella sp.]
MMFRSSTVKQSTKRTGDGNSIPIRPDIAAEVREHTIGKEKPERVFYVSKNPVKIMARLAPQLRYALVVSRCIAAYCTGGDASLKQWLDDEHLHRCKVA